MRWIRRALAAAGLLAPVMIASAAVPVLVLQNHRAFSVRELSLKAGGIVRFSNADEFLHHIYIHSPSFSFNSGEQPPGRDVEVPFTSTGTFEVRCEVHPKMLLTVSVN